MHRFWRGVQYASGAKLCKNKTEVFASVLFLNNLYFKGYLDNLDLLMLARLDTTSTDLDAWTTWDTCPL